MKSRYSLVRGDRILPATILGLSSQVPCTGADLLRSLMLLRGRILLATIFLLPSHGPCTTCRCLQGWLVWDQPLFQTTRPPTRCASAPSIPLGSECVLLLSRSSDHPMPASLLPLLHLSSFPCSRESIERLLLAPVVVLGPREPPAAFAISRFLREAQISTGRMSFSIGASRSLAIIMSLELPRPSAGLSLKKAGRGGGWRVGSPWKRGFPGGTFLTPSS